MVPNPFDLRGPEFLCFYAGLIVCVGAALWALRDLGGNGPAAASRERMPEITDPYLVSCLRGGREEVWRLATVTLIDRGLLKVKENNEVKTRSKADPSHGQNDVERAAINWFKTPHPAESISKQKELLALAEPYEKQLEALGLRPDAALRSARLVRHWLAWLALVGVAGWKIHLALARGHSNIGFLIVLAIAGLFVVSVAAGDARRITERGKALLNDLHGLFGRLKEQGPTTTRRAGQATQELVWLAAVFGVAALPVAQFAYAQQLYPAPVSSSGGTGGDSSSSSSSCGSSCGGGGCGGGCGGCGS